MNDVVPRARILGRGPFLLACFVSLAGCSAGTSRDASVDARPADAGREDARGVDDAGFDATSVDTGVDAARDVALDGPRDARVDALADDARADASACRVAFGARATYDSAESKWLASGDFNADGITDIAAAVRGFRYGAELSIGTAQGGFRTGGTWPVATSLANQTNCIAAADFDRDGALDIAVTSENLSSVSILLGDGHGAFGAPRVVGADSRPVYVVADDLNGDGRVDLAVASFVGAVDVLLADDRGGYTVSGRTTMSAVQALAAADFDRDGRRDLLAVGGGVQLAFLHGQGDGSFDAPRYQPFAGSNAVQMLVRDFDEDGTPDVALSSTQVNPGLYVLLSRGDGTFAVRGPYLPSGFPAGIDSADFDGDGHQDLVAVTDSNSPGTVTVLLGDGHGGMSPAVAIPVAVPASRVVAADVDRDGRKDFVLNGSANLGGNAGLGVYLAQPCPR